MKTIIMTLIMVAGTTAFANAGDFSTLFNGASATANMPSNMGAEKCAIAKDAVSASLPSQFPMDSTSCDYWPMINRITLRSDSCVLKMVRVKKSGDVVFYRKAKCN